MILNVYNKNRKKQELTSISLFNFTIKQIFVLSYMAQQLIYFFFSNCVYLNHPVNFFVSRGGMQRPQKTRNFRKNIDEHFK